MDQLTLRTPEDVQETVLSIAAEVLATEEPLNPGMNLRSELDADSLSLIMLFMALEDEFGGTIPEEDFERISTLGDIIDYINRRLAESASHG